MSTEELRELEATLEEMNDPEAFELLKEAENDIRKGRTRPAEEILGSVLGKPRILVGAPVHNREAVLPAYLTMLLVQHLGENLEPGVLLWPPVGQNSEFDVGYCFMMNDCNEATWDIMRKFRETVGRSFPVRLMTVAGLKSYEGRKDTGRYETLAALRNMLLDEFHDDLDGPWTHLFSVDTDIILQPGTLKALLEVDKDIVAATVYNDLEYKELTGRDPDQDRRKLNVMRFSDKDKMEHANHFCDFPEGLFRCDVTGAVYLMKADVVRRVRYEVDGQGEDIGFCRNALRAGFEIWADGRLRCQHVMGADKVSLELSGTPKAES